MRSYSFWAGVTLSTAFWVLPIATHADTLGQSQAFEVNQAYDARGASTISSTLRAMGQNAYFYVDDRYWEELTNNQRNFFSGALDRLVTIFDTTIYPRSIALWGSEPKPGIDGDPRMTILIEDVASTIGGYFQTINEYTKAQAPGSNVREMFYVNADSVFSESARSFMAHEFEHLISFNQKELLLDMRDDLWLDEARAEYNITNVGFDDLFDGSTLSRRAQAFAREPSDSLIEWPNTSADYAIASIFSHYVADRFGPEVMARTIHSHTNGVGALQESLLQGSRPGFANVFSDWMVASLVNNTSVDAKYQYARAGLQSIHVPIQQAVIVDGSASYRTTIALKEWQPFWFQLDGLSTVQTPILAVQVTAEPGLVGNAWMGGAVIATYADAHRRVIPLEAITGQAGTHIPVIDGVSHLSSVVLALSHGDVGALGDRQVLTRALTIIATPGEASVTPAPTPSPTGQPTDIHDGDLIRRPGQGEVYVIWGRYRRYLPAGVLELYGFQNRPVIAVPDDIFNRYTTSNYMRVVNGTKVYAAWPDGTKHWLNITAAQWDASGRDWGAIFTINEAEVNFYKTGPDVTR